MAEGGDVQKRGGIVVHGVSLQRESVAADPQGQRDDRLVAVEGHHAVVSLEHGVAEQLHWRTGERWYVDVVDGGRGYPDSDADVRIDVWPQEGALGLEP